MVKSIRQEGEQLILDIAIELKPSRFGNNVGEALYTITLDAEKLDHFTGSFTGTNKQQQVGGKPRSGRCGPTVHNPQKRSCTPLTACLRPSIAGYASFSDALLLGHIYAFEKEKKLFHLSF